MGDLKDKNNGNTNSAGDSQQWTPDPIPQASDNPTGSHKMEQSGEIIRNTKIPVPVADATLLPNQFMGTPVGMQAVPSAGDIIESILRFKLTILAVFLLVAVPAIAAIWTLVVPMYRAEAQVRVRPIIPYLVFQTEDSGKIPLYDSFVNTQVSIITSETVLQRVLDQPAIRETQWYKNPPKSLMELLRGYPPSPIDRLGEILSARPRKETEIIDVAFMDSNAEEAQLIANTVLNQYIIYIGTMNDDTGGKILDGLKAQYDLLEKDILDREETIADLRKTLRTGTPEELISSKRLRLDETQARLSQVRQSIDLLQWELNRTATEDGNDVPDAAADGNDVTSAAADRIQTKPKYYEDVEWRRLDDNVRTMRHNIANSLLTPNHPDSARIDKELQFAEEQLKLREEQLNEQWRDRLKNPAGALTIAGASSLSYEEGLLYIEHQLARSQREEKLLADELEQQQTEFAALFESAQLLDKENNALLHQRELFSAVRQRKDQKDMERNVPGSIEVLAPAYSSTRPYNDRRIAFTVMVMVLALGAGSGLAYLKANRNQAIYTPKDMPYPMQVPFLGYIPVAPVLSQGNEVDPATLESVRVVRTALLSRLGGKDNTTVLITSSTEGTGKSTFSLMLAESLARSGRKVLLIDADFRKMTLTRQFNLSDKSGFIQSLSRVYPDNYYIYKTEEVPGLSFMPAGEKGRNGAAFDETANGTFGTHIDKLRKQYNTILLDSPPVLPVADATILSNQVDGTIIVERESVSRRADVINTLTRLSSAGGHLLGTVFIGSSSLKNYA